MIDKNDLRLGNWLHNPTYHEDAQIRTISENELCNIGGHLEHYKNLNPISISPDILAQSGFHLTPHEQSHDIWTLDSDDEKYEFRVIELNGWVVSKGFGVWNIELCTVRYLHELQNVIWIIGGFELNFKPE